MFDFNQGELPRYKGVLLEEAEVLLGEGFILPIDYLHEIDARKLPELEEPIKRFPFLLPNAKGIISSKAHYHSIIIDEIKENEILIRLDIDFGHERWDHPLGLTSLLVELESLVAQSNLKNFELDGLYIDESYGHALIYHIKVPEFNLKFVYDYINGILVDLEMKAYKNVLKKAIDHIT